MLVRGCGQDGGRELGDGLRARPRAADCAELRGAARAGFGCQTVTEKDGPNYLGLRFNGGAAIAGGSTCTHAQGLYFGTQVGKIFCPGTPHLRPPKRPPPPHPPSPPFGDGYSPLATYLGAGIAKWGVFWGGCWVKPIVAPSIWPKTPAIQQAALADPSRGIRTLHQSPQWPWGFMRSQASGQAGWESLMRDPIWADIVKWSNKFTQLYLFRPGVYTYISR